MYLPDSDYDCLDDKPGTFDGNEFMTTVKQANIRTKKL